MASGTVEIINEIIGPLVRDLGFELVEIQLRREKTGLVLRVIIYKKEGISLADCTLVSREVGYLLEVDDPIGSAYSLEVSSPGLDRPMVTARDFERNKGRKIKVVFDDMDEKKTVVGIVQTVEDELFVYVDTGKNNFKIDLASINNARLVIEF